MYEFLFEKKKPPACPQDIFEEIEEEIKGRNVVEGGVRGETRIFQERRSGADNIVIIPAQCRTREGIIETYRRTEGGWGLL